jgi:REase_DpnII-MboI
VTLTEPGHTIAPYLGAQLNAFRARILASNRPGDLDGLCARHIMGDRADIGWEVDPLSDDWLADNAEHLDDAGPLASAGYALTALTGARPDLMPKIRAALGRFMQRDHLRIGGPTFLHDTRTLLGTALVVRGVRPEMPEAATWLATTLSDPRLQPASQFHELIQSHVLTAITGQPAEPVRTDTLIDPADLALVYWMIGQNTARLVDPTDHHILSQRIMHAVMQADPAELTITQAALLASAASAITNVGIDQVLLSRTHLSLLLRRFPAAMRRWRWDSSDRIKEAIHWPITSEREVQDVLWLVLRSVFDDVVDEDTNPKVGHASTRADFGIPSLRLLVEVKYVYDGTTAEFKKIEQEVMIDSVAYLQRVTVYDEIVVFIYDSTASVEHHDLTRDTLIKVPGIADVIIVSRPGVLAQESSRSKAKQVNATAAKAVPVKVAPAVKKAAPQASAATRRTTADAPTE